MWKVSVKVVVCVWVVVMVVVCAKVVVCVRFALFCFALLCSALLLLCFALLCLLLGDRSGDPPQTCWVIPRPHASVCYKVLR